LKRDIILKHQFVEFMPEIIEEGTLYVSMEYATAIHMCCCGCGNKVVTPLSPTDWKLTYDGRAITLDPSIGNWGFACRSHYWIKGDRVRWSGQWTREEVEAGRREDRFSKARYFAKGSSAQDESASPGDIDSVNAEGSKKGILRWLLGLFRS
jgi:Family of unknown function (DUF6527)